MKSQTLISAAIAMFAASPLQAAEFSQEATIGISRTSVDPDGNDSDPISRGRDLAATFYLDAVDTADAPLSEAAFLRHASSVTLAAALENYDSNHDVAADEEEIEALDASFSARKVFDSEDGRHWVFSALVGRGEVESEDAASNKEVLDTQTASFSLSRYVQRHTEIGLTSTSFEIEEERSGGDTGELTSVSVWGKTVRALEEGAFISLWGEVGRQSADIEPLLQSGSTLDDSDFEGSFYKVGAAYFPNAMVEVGAEMTRVSHSVVLSSSTGIGDGFSAWAEYFLTEQTSIALSVARHTIDILDEEFDIDTVSVEGRMRF